MTDNSVILNDITERELEILALLKERYTNQEIADQLFLAISTVKWYIKQLNSKLNTGNRYEIVEAAEKLGLLDVSRPAVADKFQRQHHNLPRQTTPFVGRDAELEELSALLMSPEVRLLTILAPGGMGKTRIALELAEQQLSEFD
ncbi:MAG: winged helix-turn-helix transcriptional regulator, partial [Anaerolineae bacterium]|nr:winged helix-turn-helix transcriptional regulator [Anaerolineae bacterium]